MVGGCWIVALECAHKSRVAAGAVVKFAAGEADPAGVGSCRRP